MRKIHVLLFIGFLVSINAHAQVKKATLTIGGSVSGSSSFYDNNGVKSNNFTFSVAPEIGYFIIDNFELGIKDETTFRHLKIEYNQSGLPDQESSTTYSELGFFCNKFFGEGKILPFVGAGFNYGIWSGDNTNHTKELTLDVKGGIAIFLKQTVSLNLMVDYKRFNVSSDNYDSNSNLLYLGTGIRVYLPLKK